MTRPATRELALSERPVEWLITRHDELMAAKENVNVGLICRIPIPLDIVFGLDGIEDELIDRDDMGELNRTKQLDKDLWDRAQAIIQRGSNR